MTSENKVGLSSESMQKKKLDHSYRPDFEYKTRNIYNDRLKDFEEFVIMDNDSEKLSGKWNQEVFNREAPLYLEIGTGYGHFMREHCETYPDVNFIGLDYRFKRSFELAKKLAKLENKKFRYLRAKGERIEFMFGPGELDRIYYFFPDPWPKSRHHKKRLFQEPFLDACQKTLSEQGELLVKTDHLGYYEWMVEILDDYNRHKKPGFDVLLKTQNLYQEHPDHFLTSFQTRFEKIFIGQNIEIKALHLKKRS